MSDEHAGGHLRENQRKDVRPTEDNESDESDSEIFRVKRRSSVKIEQRCGQDPLSISFDHQVWEVVCLCCTTTFGC